MKLTNDERVLQHIINKFNIRPRHPIAIGKQDAATLVLSELDTIKSMRNLEILRHIEVRRAPSDTDLEMYWDVNLTESGLNYFENKSEKAETKKVENHRFTATTLLTILAIVLSGISLLLDWLQITGRL